MQRRLPQGAQTGVFWKLLEAVSEQRAARCIVAAGVLLERGLPRDVESLHPRACMGVPSPCSSCKICCQGQITQRCMPEGGPYTNPPSLPYPWGSGPPSRIRICSPTSGWCAVLARASSWMLQLRAEQSNRPGSQAQHPSKSRQNHPINNQQAATAAASSKRQKGRAAATKALSGPPHIARTC